jgi:hypothetical protein
MSEMSCISHIPEEYVTFAIVSFRNVNSVFSVGAIQKICVFGENLSSDSILF